MDGCEYYGSLTDVVERKYPEQTRFTGFFSLC